MPEPPEERVVSMKPICVVCRAVFSPKRRKIGKTTCLDCGDKQAHQVKHTVLTPHKQGPMYFTTEFAREAAQGINNKGGLVK